MICLINVFGVSPILAITLSKPSRFFFCSWFVIDYMYKNLLIMLLEKRMFNIYHLCNYVQNLRNVNVWTCALSDIMVLWTSADKFLLLVQIWLCLAWFDNATTRNKNYVAFFFYFVQTATFLLVLIFLYQILPFVHIEQQNQQTNSNLQQFTVFFVKAEWGVYFPGT